VAPSFLLIEKKQKIKSAKRLLYARAFALQSGQNHGLESFAPLHSLIALRFSKISYALPRTRPPSFCPLSPEAVLPTGRRKDLPR
jgi:hypothetical protein